MFDYLKPLATNLQRSGVTFRYNSRVTNVARAGGITKKTMGAERRRLEPFRLLYVNIEGEQSFATFGVVIDATGLTQPSRMGPGGLSALNEDCYFDAQPSCLKRTIAPCDSSKYSGKIVALVGAGYSAATSAINLMNCGVKELLWVTKKDTIDNGTLYDVIDGDVLQGRYNLCQTANILVKSSDSTKAHVSEALDTNHSICRHFGGFQVVAINRLSNSKYRLKLEALDNIERADVDVDVDFVISNTGFKPDPSILSELQVHMCYASDGPMKLAATLLGKSGDCMEQATAGIESLLSPEPDLYIIGSKSYGRNSAFLLKIGIEQAKEVALKIKSDYFDN